METKTWAALLIGGAGLLATFLAAGCDSASRVPRSTTTGTTTAGTTGGTTGGSTTGGSTTSGGTTGGGGATFASMCGGQATTLTGTVVAPNGHDPIPNAFVYVPTTVGTFPPTVACELCVNPIDDAAATITTGADGTFILDISNLAPTSQVSLTVNKGRFRRATTIPLTACTANVVPPQSTVLPGKAGMADDIPKIAVATGSRDQLDVVLAAMGLDSSVGFDCFEGRINPATSGHTLSKLTTPCGQRTNLSFIEDLLSDETKLETYNLLFLSCVPGKFKSLTAAQQMTITNNLKTWTQKGGRLFVTDNSYDYLAQAFPSDVAFANGSGTVDAANVGVGGPTTAPASYAGKINDTTLAAWLALVGAVPSGATSLTLTGYLNKWSVVQSVPSTTIDVVDATNAQAYSSSTSTTPGPAMTYPQSIKFDIADGGGNACGRAIYTSYHTLDSTTTNPTLQLSPQERVLEYLMFEADSCVGPVS
jgi:hypothetical protein